jgi:hypothetical protein
MLLRSIVTPIEVVLANNKSEASDTCSTVTAFEEYRLKGLKFPFLMTKMVLRLNMLLNDILSEFLMFNGT